MPPNRKFNNMAAAAPYTGTPAEEAAYRAYVSDGAAQSDAAFYIPLGKQGFIQGLREDLAHKRQGGRYYRPFWMTDGLLADLEAEGGNK